MAGKHKIYQILKKNAIRYRHKHYSSASFHAKIMSLAQAVFKLERISEFSGGFSTEWGVAL